MGNGGKEVRKREGGQWEREGKGGKKERRKAEGKTGEGREERVIMYTWLLCSPGHSYICYSAIYSKWLSSEEYLLILSLLISLRK